MTLNFSLCISKIRQGGFGYLYNRSIWGVFFIGFAGLIILACVIAMTVMSINRLCHPNKNTKKEEKSKHTYREWMRVLGLLAGSFALSFLLGWAIADTVWTKVTAAILGLIGLTIILILTIKAIKKWIPR